MLLSLAKLLVEGLVTTYLVAAIIKIILGPFVWSTFTDPRLEKTLAT
jgi:hypothetical protein